MAKTTKHTMKINAEGNADAKLKDVEKGVNKVTDATDKSSVAFAKMALKAIAASAAINEVKQVASEALREFANLDAATGRLERSYKQLGGSAGDLARASKRARKNLDLYGTSVISQVDALRKLADASGSMSTAEKDLQRAINISAAEGYPDITKAVDLLAKARKGEVEEVKQLTGINKDMAESLGKISDAATRGTRTIAVLDQTYEGAADSTTGAQTKADEFKHSIDLLEASLGGVLYALGDETIGVIKAMGEFFGVIDENETVLEKAVSSLNQLERGIKNAQGFDWKAASQANTSGLGTFAAIAAGIYGAGAGGAQPQTMEFTESEVYGPGAGPINLATYKNYGPLYGQAPKPKKKEKKKKNEFDFSEEEEDQFYARQYMSAMRGGAKFDELAEGRRKGAYDKDLKRRELERELEIRDEIAELQRKGLTYEAEMLKIRKSDMTQQEMALAIEELHLDRVEKIKEARKASFDAAVMGAEGLMQVAGDLGANEAVLSTVHGLKETAFAVSSAVGMPVLGIPPDPAGAVAHGIAAARHFAAAATAPGGKGGAAPKGGGGGGRAGMPTMGTEMQNRRDLERGPRETNITIDFSRSVGVGPQAAQELAKEVSRGMRLTSGEVY